MMDLSKFSTEDLHALKAGDLSKVSTEGLMLLRGQTQAAPTMPAEPPSLGSVAANAAIKGVAGIPDMFLNAPQNLINLGKTAYGTAAGALGRPDIPANMEITPPPNYVHRGLESLGAISPAAEPQTGPQRLLDTAIQSGVGMLANPAAGIRQVAQNVATGLVGGTAASAVKEATGSNLAALAAGALVPGAAQRIRSTAEAKISAATAPSAQALRDQTLLDAQSAGYVIPSSRINPTVLNTKLESIGGKAAVNQEASIRNQTITNQLAAKEVGLPMDQPITEASLTAVRAKAGQVYEDVSQLLPTATTPYFPRYHETDLVEQLKNARSDANLWFKNFDRTGTPSALKKAKNADAKANSIDTDLEMLAKENGRPELVTQLQQARQMIAKTYDVERALNVGNGNIDAQIIGRALDKGKPLTGNLAVIGRFAQAFPSVTREASKVPTPGVSALEAGAVPVLGGLGYLALHGPLGLALAATPLLRGPARSLALSGPYQRNLTTPGIGLTTRLRAGLPSRTGPETGIQSVLQARALAETLNQ